MKLIYRGRLSNCFSWYKIIIKKSFRSLVIMNKKKKLSCKFRKCHMIALTGLH